jgi:hypothetical protein
MLLMITSYPPHNLKKIEEGLVMKIKDLPLLQGLNDKELLLVSGGVQIGPDGALIGPVANGFQPGPDGALIGPVANGFQPGPNGAAGPWH